MASPMEVETQESQVPNVGEFEVIPSHEEKMEQALGDRVEEAIKAHTPRLTELSAIQGAVELSAIRNDAAERRLMTQDYKVHECLRHVVQLITTYKDSCSGLEWFVSVYVREINAFEEAEIERMHRMVSLGRVLKEDVKKCIELKAMCSYCCFHIVLTLLYLGSAAFSKVLICVYCDPFVSLGFNSSLAFFVFLSSSVENMILVEFASNRSS